MPKYLIERDIPDMANVTRDLVREHARQGGFPAHRFFGVKPTIDQNSATSGTD